MLICVFVVLAWPSFFSKGDLVLGKSFGHLVAPLGDSGRAFVISGVPTGRINAGRWRQVEAINKSCARGVGAVQNLASKDASPYSSTSSAQ